VVDIGEIKRLLRLLVTKDVNGGDEKDVDVRRLDGGGLQVGDRTLRGRFQ